MLIIGQDYILVTFRIQEGQRHTSKANGAFILMLPTIVLLPTGGSRNMWAIDLLGGGLRYKLKLCFLPFENSLDIRG